MTILEDLKSQGWHLSSEGFDLCSENLDKLTTFAIIKKALDMDLRDIGENFLPDDLTKGKIDNFSGPGVVQIQKIKNASAPKYEYGSGAPPLLRLLLTDGNNYVNCLQWGHWKNISMETPPGTKLYLKPGKLSVQNNFLLLSEHQFTVLGGCVASMVDKWELCRQLASHIRTKENLDSSGPPPWIPFGRPIVGVKPAGKAGHFKALESETKDAKEDAVFKQQRQANIAQVSRVKEAKVKSFGGRKDMKPPAISKPEPYANTSYSQSGDSIEDGDPRRYSDGGRGGRRGLPRNEPSARSNPAFKDNKLENRSKLGDFITLKQQQAEVVQPYQPKVQPNRPFPAGNRAPPVDNRRQQPLANMMEQVKIYGYDNQNAFVGDSTLKPGMEVVAKYWEDNQYYRAVIHAVGKEGKTCVVHFLDYGNYEEVLVHDVKDRNWNAGPITFQPAPRGNYENYPSLHAPNSGHRKGQYGRPEFRPSAKIYQPPSRRDAHS